MAHDNRTLLTNIFRSGIDAVNGWNAVRAVVRTTSSSVRIAGKPYLFSRINKIVVIGAGKASFAMARALDELLGARIHSGIVITKEGHGGRLDHIEVAEASHPLPDMRGVRATRRLLSLARTVDRDTLLIVLLSGGASSLLVAPDGISLSDKIKTTSLLLNAGACIDELNTVRKQLSLVKGGGLGRMFYPAQIVTLIISDVMGNRLDIIGSGPTVIDGSTPEQALDVLARYGISNKVPRDVIRRLEQKKHAAVPTALHPRTRNIIIADNTKAVDACAKAVRRLGIRPVVLTTSLHGEAREAGHVLASIAGEMKRSKKKAGTRIGIISSGETTVTVAGTGKGGRNQELALSFAMDIQGQKGISLLSAGTDGTDGPTDAAGAFVDNTTVHRIQLKGMDPSAYLMNNDSYTALQKAGALLKTGATGTNVMDIQLILIS